RGGGAGLRGSRGVEGGGRRGLRRPTEADVTARPVRPVLPGGPTALGAAFLAGLAAGTFRDTADAVARTVTPSVRVREPDERARAVYEERDAQYRALYDGAEGALGRPATTQRGPARRDGRPAARPRGR